MTTATAPAPQRPLAPDPARASPSTSRIVAIVLASLALAALVAGAGVSAYHASKQDGDGYYTTAPTPLSTPTHALVSDGLEIDDDGAEAFVADGGLGTIRVSATGTRAKPVFVGIARTSQVDAYLGRVSRDDVTDFDLDPFTVQTARRDGDATPAAPSRETFWAKSSTGAGTRTITWPVKDGAWDVVVMNADGSPGVRTSVTAAARFPVIGWIGYSLLGIGALLALGAGGLAIGDRKRG